jgi:cytochrome c oxidase subunit 1
MLVSFFVPGGAAKGGWTSYTPLRTSPIKARNFDPFWNGQTLWLIGFIFLITSSLLGAVNFITTIIQLRAKGLTWMRLPFFVWAQFVTAFLLLLAFPAARSRGRHAADGSRRGTSFLHAERAGGERRALQISGGGSPLLWQHLFWFLGHPEVYVLILPAWASWPKSSRTTRASRSGATNRWSSALVLGFLSFIVWAHHMFMTGMGTT